MSLCFKVSQTSEDLLHPTPSPPCFVLSSSLKPPQQLQVQNLISSEGSHLSTCNRKRKDPGPSVPGQNSPPLRPVEKKNESSACFADEMWRPGGIAWETILSHKGEKLEEKSRAASSRVHGCTCHHLCRPVVFFLSNCRLHLSGSSWCPPMESWC